MRKKRVCAQWLWLRDMKVIIAGGTGLIGRALTESLARDGHSIIILSRSPENIIDLPKGAKVVAWDGRTVEAWAEQLENADAIVNLAGASLSGEGFLPSRWTKHRKQVIRESRLNAGSTLVAALHNSSRKPGLLIQSSAIGYYGPQDDKEISEDSPAADDFLASICVDWEESTRAVEDLGLRRVVIRTGLPLTTKGGAFPLLVLPFKLFLGNTFGDGRQYYSWIHFDDYIAALRFLLESSEASGVYNLTAPNPVSNRIFAQTLGRVMRRPSFFPLPAFALKLALGEVSTVVLDGQRVLPKHLLAEGFSFDFPDLQLAFEDLLKK